MPELRLPPSLRLAESADCDRLAQLLREAFDFHGEETPLQAAEMAPHLARHLNATPGFEALLAVNGGKTQGFALFSPVYWTGDSALALFLKELFVSGEARGQGLGQVLMSGLAAVAAQRGWQRIVWTVDHGNRQAFEFYEGLPGATRLDKSSYAISGEALKALAEAANGDASGDTET